MNQVAEQPIEFSSLEQLSTSDCLQKGEIKSLAHVTSSIQQITHSDTTTSESLVKLYKTANVLIEYLIFKQKQEQKQENTFIGDVDPKTWQFWQLQFVSENYLNLHIQRRHPEHSNSILDWNDLETQLQDLISIEIPDRLMNQEIEEYHNWLTETITEVRRSQDQMNVDYVPSDEETSIEDAPKQLESFSRFHEPPLEFFPVSKRPKCYGRYYKTMDENQSIFDQQYQNANQIKTLEIQNVPFSYFPSAAICSSLSQRSDLDDECRTSPNITLPNFTSVASIQGDTYRSDSEDEDPKFPNNPLTTQSVAESFQSAIIHSECDDEGFLFANGPLIPITPTPADSYDISSPRSESLECEYLSATQKRPGPVMTRQSRSMIEDEILSELKPFKTEHTRSLSLGYNIPKISTPKVLELEKGKPARLTSVNHSRAPSANITVEIGPRKSAGITSATNSQTNSANVTADMSAAFYKKRGHQRSLSLGDDFPEIDISYLLKLETGKHARRTSAPDWITSADFTVDIGQRNTVGLTSAPNVQTTTATTSISAPKPSHHQQFQPDPDQSITCTNFSNVLFSEDDVGGLEIDTLPKLIPETQPYWGVQIPSLLSEPRMTTLARIASQIDSQGVVVYTEQDCESDIVYTSQSEPAVADKVYQSGQKIFLIPNQQIATFGTLGTYGITSEEEALIPPKMILPQLNQHNPHRRELRKQEYLVKGIGMKLGQIQYSTEECASSMDNADLQSYKNSNQDAKQLDKYIREKIHELRRTRAKSASFLDKYPSTSGIRQIWYPLSDPNEIQEVISNYLENKLDETEDYETEIAICRQQRDQLISESELGHDVVEDIKLECENLEMLQEKKAVPHFKKSQLTKSAFDICEAEVADEGIQKTKSFDFNNARTQDNPRSTNLQTRARFFPPKIPIGSYRTVNGYIPIANKIRARIFRSQDTV